MKGVVSRVSSENLLEAFSLEPCVVSTLEAVVVTRQVSEALPVGASSVALRPPVPSISEITDRHTARITDTRLERKSL